MKAYTIFGLVAVGIFLIDQGIKEIFLDGYGLFSPCISLELHINYGVAFSMFAFLGSSLKWIQTVLVVMIFIYMLLDGLVQKYPFSSATIFGGAVGNLYDRFTQGGVVDYVYWHCGFDFAVFNFADVMIDIGVVLILLFSFIDSRKETSEQR